MVARRRVALFGGDGRIRDDRFPGWTVRRYRARRYGGNGELRRLDQALRAGGVDKVVVLARWNGHSGTRRIQRLCRRLGVPIEIWNRGS